MTPWIQSTTRNCTRSMSRLSRAMTVEPNIAPNAIIMSQRPAVACYEEFLESGKGRETDREKARRELQEFRSGHR